MRRRTLAHHASKRIYRRKLILILDADANALATGERRGADFAAFAQLTTEHDILGRLRNGLPVSITTIYSRFGHHTYFQ
jgi:hypothetical protein